MIQKPKASWAHIVVESDEFSAMHCNLGFCSRLQAISFSNKEVFKDFKESRDRLSSARSSNSGGGGSDVNSARKKPIFRREHYDAIAKLLGQKIIYSILDENDYHIIEAFAEMFAEDNPMKFDKDSFRDAVYEAHSRRRGEGSTEGN